MTTSPSLEAGQGRLSAWLAAEIRAELGRRGMSVSALSRQLHKSQAWGARRVGMTADVDITIDELDEVAAALGIEAEGILARARSARSEGFEPPTFWFGVSEAPLQLIQGGRSAVRSALTAESRVATVRGRHLRAVS